MKLTDRLASRLFWIVVLIILLSPPVYWASGVGQAASGLSAQVQEANDLWQNSPKAEALHRLSLPMRIERLLIYPLLLLTFQLSGLSGHLRRRLEIRLQPLRRFIPARRPGSGAGFDLITVVGFVILLHLALYLLYLPFNFYRGFIVAHQFGLSTQTAPGWLSDWGKSVLVSLLTGALPWVALYGLMAAFPRRWPVPAGVLLFIFGAAFAVLSPILITPLFYEIRPLQDTDLRQRIFRLAELANTPVSDIFVLEASAKTTEANAYVAGFGQAQRMVLYDTLLNNYPADQIEVILAHELGHWYYHHVFWSVIGLGAAGWLGLFGLKWLLDRTWQRLGLRAPADIAGLPYVMAVIALVSTLSLPVQNSISRYAENQADEFALRASQKPDAFIAMFIQLAEQNLSLVNPPAWEKFVFYTHPPIAERVARAAKERERLNDRMSEERRGYGRRRSINRANFPPGNACLSIVQFT